VLTGCIIAAIALIVWIFFVETLSLTINRLGETRFTPIATRYSGRFFYYPFHQSLYKDDSFELLCFTSILSTNIARLALGVLAYLMFFSLPHSTPEIILYVVIVVFVYLLFGDFFPRLLSLRSPEKALSSCFFISSFFLYLSTPIAICFLWLMRQSSKLKKEEHKHDAIDEIQETIVEILQETNVEAKFGASDKKLLASVIKFKDRIVREVMVPRVNLFSLPLTTPINEAAKLLMDKGYSRTPIYRDTVDDIIGVLMFKDLLELYIDCERGKKNHSLLEGTIEGMLKGVFYTPETKKVSSLLQEFRTKQMHMAIVVDEYGGTEGVVTIEDILEEIVGEIADEYDVDEETLFTRQDGGGWIVDARMSLLDAEETFDIHIPQEGEYDTIGGYIFQRVGSIPEKGLRIHHEDFDLEILSSTARSVEKVKITPRKGDKRD